MNNDLTQVIKALEHMHRHADHRHHVIDRFSYRMRSRTEHNVKCHVWTRVLRRRFRRRFGSGNGCAYSLFTFRIIYSRVLASLPTSWWINRNFFRERTKILFRQKNADAEMWMEKPGPYFIDALPLTLYSQRVGCGLARISHVRQVSCTCVFSSCSEISRTRLSVLSTNNSIFPHNDLFSFTKQASFTHVSCRCVVSSETAVARRPTHLWHFVCPDRHVYQITLLSHVSRTHCLANDSRINK